jgi:K+-sensing histidine kinase KdpD
MMKKNKLLKGNEPMDFKKARVNIYDFLTTTHALKSTDLNITINFSVDVYISINREIFGTAIFNLIGELNFLSAPCKDSSVDVSYKMQDDFTTILILIYMPGALKDEHDRRYNKDSYTHNQPSTGLFVNTAQAIIQAHGGELKQKNIAPDSIAFFVKIPAITHENFSQNEHITNNNSNKEKR